MVRIDPMTTNENNIIQKPVNCFFLQINSVVSISWEHWLLLTLKESHPIICSLTHLFPMHTFSIPWKHQKTLRWKGCVGNKWVNIYTTEIDIQFLGNKISKIAFWLKLGVVSKFHLRELTNFYSPWYHQTTIRFLMILGRIDVNWLKFA